MFDTKPLSPPAFWRLFETWMQLRVTPGMLWTPNGWTEWAIADFHGFVLDHALGELQSDEGDELAGLPYDVSRNIPVYIGSSVPVGFAFNTQHDNETTYLLGFHAQSPHQADEEFLSTLLAELNRFAHGRPVNAFSDATPAVIASVIRDDIAEHLVKHHKFEHHFSVHIGGAGAHGATPKIHTLSLRAKSHQRRTKESRGIADEETEIERRVQQSSPFNRERAAPPVPNFFQGNRLARSSGF